MLTEEQRMILSKTASSKYQLNINSAQIAHLILDSFECNFGTEKNSIKGKVKDFRKFPLRMTFDAPEGSTEREVLEKHLKQGNKNTDLEFNCKLSTVSNIVKINTLSITSSQFQELEIKEKLLGPASSAYVSREQINQLSGEVFSSLNVFEEYEMPEYQFQQNFVDDFIKLATEENFQQVPALQALKELSSYGLDFGQDLQAGKAMTANFSRGTSIQSKIMFCKMLFINISHHKFIYLKNAFLHYK
jgi:hypothetical protein